MAILGTFVDQISSSFAGSGLVNSMSFISNIHSLPATSPEAVIVEMTSLATAGLVMGVPAILRLGGNASVVTMGIAQGSAVSQPVVAFTITSIVFHSVVR